MKGLRHFFKVRSPLAIRLERGTVIYAKYSGYARKAVRVRRWYVTLRFGRKSVRLAVSEESARWLRGLETRTERRRS